ncbi:hypothetical protein [Acidiphilium sp. AL]|uniref:hypothetical protein n=1 Tax=Acidiphilium sp. AL TaxID=2871704 RepID=UPI0021CB124C|nr:hypothetical protein [Acidiphilium sp. AL]
MPRGGASILMRENEPCFGEQIMRTILRTMPLAALVLAGCATGPSLSERMSAYVGRPESILVKQLGVPNRRIRVAGVTYFAYVHQHFHYTSGSYGFGMGPIFDADDDDDAFFGPAFGGGFPARAYTDTCVVTFTLKDKMVQSYTMRGNACY